MWSRKRSRRWNRSQTTAATAEESAAASEELSAQAETAKEIVRSLESLAGGVSRIETPVKTTRPAAKKKTALAATVSSALPQRVRKVLTKASAYTLLFSVPENRRALCAHCYGC